MAETLKPVAEKYKSKLNFAVIDAKAFGAHAANLNLATDSFPSFAIQETVKNEKYPFEGNKLTEKKIGAFVKNFVDGKLSPSIKSEPVPDKQDTAVQVVVAHSYNDIVLDDSKDVLIEFYAPWCGHCKAYKPPFPLSYSLANIVSLAPNYEKLAEMYTTNPAFADKVTIAKLDATLNDVPDEIAGFPTIKLYPAGGKKSPAEYSGSRTIEDLANFVRDNGKYKIDAWAADQGEDIDMEDVTSAAGETMAKAAPAATTSGGIVDKVKSVVGEAADAAQTVMADTDYGGTEEHDEL